MVVESRWFPKIVTGSRQPPKYSHSGSFPHKAPGHTLVMHSHITYGIGILHIMSADGHEADAESTDGAAERVAIYPGSFDPPTKGHLDTVARAARIFDRVIVGVGMNPVKDPFIEDDDR